MVYGFIGLGNMASAILRGMAKSGSYAADTLCGYNPTVSKTLALQKELGLVRCESVEETARRADIIVLRRRCRPPPAPPRLGFPAGEAVMAVGHDG